MNRAHNSVQIIGLLGQDVTYRELDNGGKIAKVSVATNEYYKNPKTGEKMQETTWHNVVAWGHTATYLNQNFCKGSQILCRGRLVNNNYKDKQGNMVYRMEIKADELRPIGKSSSDNQ
jgi:single-strand DNA-binding protein